MTMEEVQGAIFSHDRKLHQQGAIGRSNVSKGTNGQADGRTEGRTDGRTDGRTGGQTDGRADRRTDGRTDERTGGRTGAGWVTVRGITATLTATAAQKFKNRFLFASFVCWS
uniref:Uncharacterized protein n=1 Tax=Angiostrongylus cantonensis TaxID=6313 RepID=A0A0K0DF51_ANGCA